MAIFGDQEEERYEATTPKASHIVGRTGHMYVRIFKTPEEAAAFFGHENASPLRMHLMNGAHSGKFRSKSFGQLGSADASCPHGATVGVFAILKAGIVTDIVDRIP